MITILATCSITMLMPTVKEFIRIFSYGSVAYNKERPLTKTNSRAGGAFVLLYNRIPRGIPGGRPKGTTTRYEICRPSEHGPYGRTDIIILFPFFRSGLLKQAFLRCHSIGTTIFPEVAPRRPLRGKWCSITVITGFLSISHLQQPSISII